MVGDTNGPFLHCRHQKSLATKAQYCQSSDHWADGIEAPEQKSPQFVAKSHEKQVFKTTKFHKSTNHTTQPWHFAYFLWPFVKLEKQPNRAWRSFEQSPHPLSGRYSEIFCRRISFAYGTSAFPRPQKSGFSVDFYFYACKHITLFTVNMLVCFFILFVFWAGPWLFPPQCHKCWPYLNSMRPSQVLDLDSKLPCFMTTIYNIQMSQQINSQLANQLATNPEKALIFNPTRFFFFFTVRSRVL